MDDPAHRPVTKTIRRLLESETGRATEDEYQRELGLYMAAGGEKRRVIDHRLRAFADLPAAKKRTIADVVVVAKRLGGAQSNVYRLLKRIQADGPVSGLMPRNRLKPKSGVAADGFGPPVDGWIAEALLSKPDASISEIAKTLSSKAKLQKAQDPADALTLPSLASVRRRVQALRSQGTNTSLMGLLGETLLIDQCPTDIVVKVPPGGRGRPELRRVFVVMVLDASSSTVLGVGAFVDGDTVRGLTAALRDLKTRIVMLALRGVWFAGPPSKIRWMVSDDLIPFVVDVEKRASSVKPSVDLACYVVEDGRVGRELYRHLGGRIKDFALLARNPDDVVTASDDIVRRPDDEGIFTLAGAEAALRSAATRRDGERIDGIPKSRPKRMSAAAAFSETTRRLFEGVSLAGATRLGSTADGDD